MDRLTATKQYLTETGLLHKCFDDEAPCLRHAIETLEMLGAEVIREAFSTKAGRADVIACYKGWFIAAECKSATGTLSKQQEQFLGKIMHAGGCTIEVRCMHDIISTIEQLPSLRDWESDVLV